MQFLRLGCFLPTIVPHPSSAKADSHVPEGNFSQQDQTDGVSLRRVAVVGTLRHHVCEVDSLPKHVACLEEQGQVKTSSQDRPASPPPHPICASGIEDEVVTGDHLSGTSFSEQGG